MSEAAHTPTSFQGDNPMDDPYFVALQASYTLAELYNSGTSDRVRRILERLINWKSNRTLVEIS